MKKLTMKKKIAYFTNSERLWYTLPIRSLNCAWSFNQGVSNLHRAETTADRTWIGPQPLATVRNNRRTTYLDTFTRLHWFRIVTEA